MSDKKGFKRTKAPTKGDMQKTVNEEMPAMKQTVQFLGQQLMQLTQGYTHLKSQMEVLADIASCNQTDEALESNDLVMISFLGVLKETGKPFEGSAGKSSVFRVGSGKLIKEFEESLIGKKPGETYDVDVTFPEDYVENLKGKEATFTVSVKKAWKPSALDTTMQAKLDSFLEEKKDA